MVGVSGPMLAYSTARGRRFMFGLTAGSLVGSALLAAVAVAAGFGLSKAGIPADFRRAALIALALTLGIADIANRTPQLWRQVPQQLVRMLSPGVLGVVWGIDLGLIFTTKKVTSLWWLAIIGLMLVKPELLIVTVPAGAVLTALAIWAWSLRVKDNTACMMKHQRRLITQLRMASGFSMIGMAIILCVAAVA
jgi:hypothetical protein